MSWAPGYSLCRCGRVRSVIVVLIAIAAGEDDGASVLIRKLDAVVIFDAVLVAQVPLAKTHLYEK